MKKTIKNQSKGITLIALVITIVVLLILAGITIATLTGENGLLKRAGEAKVASENAQIAENAALDSYMAYIDGFTNLDIQNTNPAGAMPEGAKVLEGNANKGIVIKDKNDNEWVWVEVPKTIYSSEVTTTNYEGIYNALNTYASTYRNGSYGQTYSWKDEWYDGCGLSNEQYDANYKKMLSSVFSNGGFWIARYEAGIAGSDTDISLARTTRVEITETSPKAVSKQDMIPYNWVYCSDAQLLASAMTPDTTKTSSLMFGIQWDLVCKFLEVKGNWDTTNPASYYINTDSTSWGNYKNIALDITSTNAKQYSSSIWSAITETKPASNILLTTGASETTNKMNIYDFAGNEFEWTLEYTSSSGRPCTNRGGYSADTGSYVPASYRGSYSATLSGYDLGSFRPVLY